MRSEEGMNKWMFGKGKGKGRERRGILRDKGKFGGGKGRFGVGRKGMEGDG